MKLPAIAVLGAGPAGLMAAQAVALFGQPLALFSATDQPSRLGGAQFLHKPIPGINNVNEPDRTITYRVRGDEPTYRRKVYGNDPVKFTSFANVHDGQEQPAWNLIETYEKLWDQFSGHINVVTIDHAWIEGALKDFSMILSTIPLVHLCRARAGLVSGFHSFQVQKIHVDTSGDFAPDDDDTIVYDGTEDRTWYRSSRLFGVGGTEWSANVKPPPLPNLIVDNKPLATTCDCYPEVTRLGRRGTWTKGVLTHDAFYEAAKIWMPERREDEVH